MKLSRKVSITLLSLTMALGIAAVGQSPVHASHVRHAAVRMQSRKSHHVIHHHFNLTRKVNRKAHKTNWFTDGLNHRNLTARSWVTYRESGHRWNARGSRCVGYFQLSPSYLGYKHGQINLNRQHQVKVGDAYAASRYGSWVGAKSFWQAHHWY